MIQDTSINQEQDSPETLKGCLWAVTTGAAVVVFTLTAWLSIQRAQIILAERRTVVAQIERNVALQERAQTVMALSEKLAKAETARRAAERELRAASANAAKRETSSPRPEPAPPVIQVAKTTVPGPSAQELAAFIEEHLLRMTGPVEAQLPDYAEEVDFHDKPHASLRAIENDRRQWGQRFPVRQIFKVTQPRIDVIQNPGGGWVATAILNLRWQLKSRTGAAIRAVTRDTWKIIPSAQGFKIVAEHSADPVTGQSKD